MTQSYNLSQLANNLNSAGQLDATDGLVNAVPAANGGTGQSAYTTGDILYASGATSLAKLSDVATGNALLSGGVSASPSWGKIGLTTHISGTLAIANGGTGVTAIPLNNVVLGNGTSAVQTIAPGLTGNVLTSDGTTWTSSPVNGTNGPRAIYFLTPASGQTFTIPAGITSIKCTVVGGGGSGGGYNPDTGNGGPGGTGESAVQWLIGLTSGLTLNVAVGAGGANQTGRSGGYGGGTSSVSSGTQTITTIQCTGGAGGGYGNGAPGANGTASGITNNTSGAAGWATTGLGATLFNKGINSPGGTINGAGGAATQGCVLIEY